MGGQARGESASAALGPRPCRPLQRGESSAGPLCPCPRGDGPWRTPGAGEALGPGPRGRQGSASSSRGVAQLPAGRDRPTAAGGRHGRPDASPESRARRAHAARDTRPPAALRTAPSPPRPFLSAHTSTAGAPEPRSPLPRSSFKPRGCAEKPGLLPRPAHRPEQTPPTRPRETALPMAAPANRTHRAKPGE